MQNLPIGIQDFRSFRRDNLLYVDKTRQIHQLITVGKYFFLSRPRRFGKSLTLSTIKEIFSGSKDLFQGLWIEANWDWQETSPVLHASFSNIGYQQLGLERAIELMLERWAGDVGIKLQYEGIALQFRELIQNLAEQQGRVVLLIDEYDKPIIDYLTNTDQAKANQQILKSFYSIIKESDPYLRLVLITGVSKFSKVSIFSDLNNLKDITLDWRFADLTGYTQEEVEHNFRSHIAFAAQRLNTNPDGVLGKMKEWYNGYSWDAKTYVYNPFSVLNFFAESTFRNFWFDTGTPAFLIDLLTKRGYVDLENRQVDQSTFESYTLENMETYSLLFQTGYLTIKSIDEFGIYALGYPNREVKESMLRHLIGAYRHTSPVTTPIVIQLRQAFLTNDPAGIIQIIYSLFKNIPSTIFLNKKEAYYHSIVFLIFHYLGLFIEAESHTSDGRLDAVVHTPTHIFILEFKLDESADKALEQIRRKGYAEKYAGAGKPIVALGINFDSEKKAVGDWKSEIRSEALN